MAISIESSKELAILIALRVGVIISDPTGFQLRSPLLRSNSSRVC